MEGEREFEQEEFEQEQEGREQEGGGIEQECFFEGDSEYWEQRYMQHKIGWDLGKCSPPIKDWVDQQTDKSISILIPGAGNAYEAAYLYEKGFRNVHIIDFAVKPLNDFKLTNPDFPVSQIHHQDFFDHCGRYDVIIEQTFFCALPPSLRVNYAKKMKELLKSNGQLVGLLFNCQFENGPPFGGDTQEYERLFNKYFRDVTIQRCENSIPPRLGNEVFIHISKPY